MAHATSTLLDIDLRIRTLSSLITNLNKRVDSPELTNHRQTPPSPAFVACNHIAILLTRGIEDANDRPIGPGRKVVAVSGRLASNLSLAVSVDADEVDPTPKDQPKFRIDTIKPSSTCLKDLATPYCVVDDPFPDYAANLLAAFRDLEVDLNGFLFMKFAIRSCLPKITHRLKADLYAFKRPLDEILDGWSPGPNDVLDPKRVRMVSSYPIIRPHLTNALVAGGEDQYEWNINTASMWITALCHVVKETKCSAGDCRSPNRQDKSINRDALHRLIRALVALRFLSYHVPIRQLLSLPSIQSRLKSERTDSVNNLMISDDDGPDMAPEGDEDASSMMLRYLRNAVAWISAINYIFQGVKTSRSFKDITLDFVVTPFASPDTSAPEEVSVNSGIAYMLSKLGLESQSEKAKVLIEEFKKIVLPVTFRGTVHCEASLMGMIVACKDDMMPLPSGVRREELQVFKKVVTENGVSAIGMGRKCCWCCSQLAEQLQVAHPHISLQVPSSHGLVFQWALPTIGISVPVAESMETALKEVWRMELGKFAEEFDKRSKKGVQSAMSSPSDSISESAPDLLGQVLIQWAQQGCDEDD